MFNKVSYRALNIAKYSGIAAGFVIASAIAIYIISQKIVQISQNIYNYNTTLERKQERISSGTRLKEEIDQIGQENESALKNPIVIDENISEVVQVIDNLAKKYSASHTPVVLSGAPTPGTSGSNKLSVFAVNYNFQMDTDIVSIIKYLENMEKNKNFISIASLSISGDEKNGWNGRATFNISGKIYYKKTN